MIKRIACLLLLFFSSPLQGQSLESVKVFQEATAAALKGSGALFVLATTEGCPPCEEAKRLLGADLRLTRHTLIELPIQDAQKLSFGNAALLQSGAVTAPKLLLVDVGDSIPETTIVQAGFVNVQSLDELLAYLPVELISSVVLDFPEEPPTFGSTAKVIKYRIATQYKNGAYNSSFEWGKIDRYLQVFERYWDVDFQRVSTGQNITFLQVNKNLPGGKNVAATAGGNTVNISPTFNFANGPWCGIVTLHETWHLYGGPSHNRDSNGLMGPSGGKGSILQSDYPWAKGWRVKAGIKRPHEEPEWMAAWMSTTGQDGAGPGQDGAGPESLSIPIEFECLVR